MCATLISKVAWLRSRRRQTNGAKQTAPNKRRQNTRHDFRNAYSAAVLETSNMEAPREFAEIVYVGKNGPLPKGWEELNFQHTGTGRVGSHSLPPVQKPVQKTVQRPVQKPVLEPITEPKPLVKWPRSQILERAPAPVRAERCQKTESVHVGEEEREVKEATLPSFKHLLKVVGYIQKYDRDDQVGEKLVDEDLVDAVDVWPKTRPMIDRKRRIEIAQTVKKRKRSKKSKSSKSAEPTSVGSQFPRQPLPQTKRQISMDTAPVVFPKPPSRAPSSLADAQFQAIAWKDYLHSLPKSGLSDAMSSAIELVSRQHIVKTVDEWIVLHGRRQTSTLWAALRIATDLDQEVTTLLPATRHSHKKEPDKRVRELALHARMHPFTYEELMQASEKLLQAP